MYKIGPYTLRDYQVAAISDLRARLARLHAAGLPRRVLLVAPTGSGKSVMALSLMAAAVDKGHTVGFITSGRQLIFQIAKHLEKAGLDFSVLMNQAGDYDYSPGRSVQVISKDTLASRIGRIPWVAPDMMIVDEADVAISSTWLGLLEQSDWCIGLTATPCMGNGRGLPWYRDMTVAANYSELIAQGSLVEIEPYSPIRPDVSVIGRTGYDYHQGQSSELMRALIGHLPQTWLKINKDRVPTVAFCVDQAHTVGACEQYNGAGIKSSYILDRTPQDEREESFRQLESGDIDVLCSCATLSRGFDLPAVACAVLAKLTRSFRLYRQMLGRIMRTYPGKTKAILIDHSGAVHDMCERYGVAGWPSGDIEWKLGEDEAEAISSPGAEKEKQVREPYTCPQCGAMWESGGYRCPNCGWEQRKRGQPVMTKDGELKLVRRARKKRETNENQQFWMECLAIAAYKGRSYSSASGMFHSQTGEWPEEAGVGPVAAVHQSKMPVASLWPNFNRRKKKRA